MKVLFDLLTLPGNGVFTVHSGKEKKEGLLKALYGTKKIELARPKWRKGIEGLSTKKPWILGIPSDNGGGIQRGANWGPLMVRQQLIKDLKDFIDLGDVRVIPHLLHDKYLNAKTIKICQKALYGRAKDLPVSPLSMAERALQEIYKKYPAAMILGIGGDHSTSYPLVKTWLKSRKDPKKAALLHFDAHTDLLEQRLGIDICFGTWTYHIVKLLHSPAHIVQVGIRSSGKDKKYWEQKLGVKQIWAKDFSKLGVEKVFKSVLAHFRKLGIEEVYVSFDIDALDEKYAAATGTPEKDGLLPSDCATLVRLLSQEIKVTGADLMEVAPFVWPEGCSSYDQKNSLSVAGDMARVLLEALKA